MNPNEQPQTPVEPTPVQPEMPETAPAPEQPTAEPTSIPMPDQTTPAVPATPAAPAVPVEQPAQQPTATDDPGKTMGIIGLLLAFFIPLVGFIVSLIAHSKSKKAGHSNTPALIGIIVSVLLFIIETLVAVLLIIGVVSLVQKCSELGPGTHYENGTTYQCGE